MNQLWALQMLTYLSLIVLIVGIVAKAVKYARAPLHIRWEIYPVPGEENERYGGSYFENLDWWTSRRAKSRVAEVRAMLTEILFVKSLQHHNRRLWYVSYPFHGGIYLIVLFAVLLCIGALAETLGAQMALGVWSVLALITTIIGVIGAIAVCVGAIGLLIRRVSDEEIRSLSTPVDYFNLVFILALALSALIAWATADPSFAIAREYVRGLMTLHPTATTIAPSVFLEMALLSAFFIYLPFTHMTHFVAKYFTYHMVRWDDHPNFRGSTLEAKVKINLQRPVHWSAKHIGEGSWAQVATSTEPSPRTMKNHDHAATAEVD